MTPKKVTPTKERAAVEEMTAWVTERYSPLVNWAPLSEDSDNGYLAPTVHLAVPLQEKFARKYPPEFIAKVATDLESHGFWGDPKRYYGNG